MSKIGCEVIKDLLPSYIDEICSGETKKLVEEHMEGCEECRRRVELMKTEDTGLKAEEKDMEAVHYMKKLKRHILTKNLFSFGILFLVIILGMMAVLFRRGGVSVWCYYVSCPILMTAAYLLLQDYIFENTFVCWKAVMGAVCAGNIIYMGILENWIIRVSRTGRLPQNIRMEALGPLAYYQLIAVSLVFVGVFTAAVWMSLKTGNICPAVLVISAVGGCAALAFVALLKRLDEPENFLRVRNRELGVILVEGVIFLLVFWLSERRRKGRNPVVFKNRI